MRLRARNPIRLKRELILPRDVKKSRRAASRLYGVRRGNLAWNSRCHPHVSLRGKSAIFLDSLTSFAFVILPPWLMRRTRHKSSFYPCIAFAFNLASRPYDSFPTSVIQNAAIRSISQNMAVPPIAYGGSSRSTAD